MERRHTKRELGAPIPGMPEWVIPAQPDPEPASCAYCGALAHAGECEPEWTPRPIITVSAFPMAEWKLVKEKFGVRRVKLPDGRTITKPSIQRSWKGV